MTRPTMESGASSPLLLGLVLLSLFSGACSALLPPCFLLLYTSLFSSFSRRSASLPSADAAIAVDQPGQQLCLLSPPPSPRQLCLSNSVRGLLLV
ncbi:hypothetical protein VPH35_061682 [Triticum aestivum]